jgi:hypothetical protein
VRSLANHVFHSIRNNLQRGLRIYASSRITCQKRLTSNQSTILHHSWITASAPQTSVPVPTHPPIRIHKPYIMTSRYSYHHRRHRRTISFTQDESTFDHSNMYGPPMPPPSPFRRRILMRPQAPWRHSSHHYYKSTPSCRPSPEDIETPHHASNLYYC